jgi:hypothetical protein
MLKASEAPQVTFAGRAQWRVSKKTFKGFWGYTPKDMQVSRRTWNKPFAMNGVTPED